MKHSKFSDIESEEYHYKFITHCKESVENHVRVLFIQYIRNNNELMLHSLSSYDAAIPSMATIEAEIMSLSKQDSEIEKIASFLTLEAGVSSIRWEVSNLKE